MKKQVKVVMLPTEKATNIGKYQDTGNLVYNNSNDIPRGIFQHLYFLSNEGIKEGDWYIDRLGIVQQCESIRDNPLTGPQSSIGSVGGKGFDKWSTQYQNRDYKDLDNCFKIVATTDESLSLICTCGAIKKVPTGLCIECGKFINTSIPRPSNEFLKKYCELGGIDEVLVEYIEYVNKIGSCSSGEGVVNGTNQYIKVAPDNTISIYPIK